MYPFPRFCFGPSHPRPAAQQPDRAVVFHEKSTQGILTNLIIVYTLFPVYFKGSEVREAIPKASAIP
jgi:hypothetical protein